MKKFLLVFTIIIFIIPSFAQDNSKKFSLEDYYLFSRFRGIDMSPDDKAIVYSLGEKEKWDGKRNYNIWLTFSGDKSNLKLTNSDKSDWSPQWSPDGTMIAFLSSRSEKNQVYIIYVSGGEARRVTFAEHGVNLFQWINNNTIAFISNEPRDSNIIAAEENAGGGYVVGTTYHTSALWTQSINDESDLKKITKGDYYISDMAAATDGKSFLLITAKNSELFESLIKSTVLWIDENGNVFYSFDDAKVFSLPAISPDNKKACFVGNTVGYSSNNALFVVDKKSGDTKNLTEEFDPTIEAVEWLDEDHITFKTPRNVHSGIYSVNMDGSVKALLSPHYVVFDYSVNPDSKEVAFVGSQYNIPNELYVNKFVNAPEDALQLTSVTSWMNDKNLGFSKVITYPSNDGTKIEAVLTLPFDYVENKSYPLLVLPHGGPDGIIKDKFNLFGQIFSGEGMIVFEPNFRGSIGYGSDFYAANRGKLGYVDYDDIMAGVDYLIKNKMVDENKMVVGGWSYGGYMTDWIIGHTNRFKAAVSVAGMSNTVSHYAQSDINHGEIADWEYIGLPIYDMENYTRSSPLSFFDKAKTPTLIMHGEADTRVSVMQSWEIYRALIDNGIDVEMILYPGAGHSITAPKQRKNVFKRWVEWYKKYLNE